MDGSAGPFVFLLQSGFIEVMQTHDRAWEGFAYVATLSLSATVICSVFYFALIQMTNAVFASMVVNYEI